MRLNSAYNSNFACRMVAGSGIALVLFVIFFVASSFRKDLDPDLKSKQVNIIIRQIGHRLLLQAGDATSRVLPVTQKQGTFLLTFERELVFSHDSLMLLSQQLLPKTQFPSGYTVTVQDCRTGGIVYGFQLNNTSPDILACSGRSQPAGRYSIEFAFPDFYENMKEKKADFGQLTSTKVDPRGVDSKPEQIKTASAGHVISQRSGELKSYKADPQSADPKSGKFKTKTSSNPLMNLVYVSIVVLLGAPLLIWRFGKNVKAVPEQHQNDALTNEAVPEGLSLGKFLFDVKGQRLLLESEVISLTDKECKVLQLLHKNFGELTPRDTLLQEVWIDEGVITGRSLDMFVSKLRKKLSGDPELRITNVHGKGYKLEITGRQII